MTNLSSTDIKSTNSSSSLKNHDANIFAENYKSKEIFQLDFFKLLNKISLSKPQNSKLNLYVPQNEILYVLNSYVSFEELNSKTSTNKIYSDLQFLNKAVDQETETYNVLILDYGNVPGSLNYNLIQDLKDKWEFVSDVLVFGDNFDLENQDDNNFALMKIKALKNIYKIPLDIDLNIEFMSLPMWRIGDSIFSIELKKEIPDDYLRPINVDNFNLLNNLKRWMSINEIRYINKIIACEKSDIIGNSESSSLKMMKMLENEINDSSIENSVLFDVKKDCNVFIFDRSCDVITPLLSELTYIGLLNEQDFDFLKEIISKENNNGNVIADNIFENLKFLNFGEVGSVLQRLLSSYGKATNTRDRLDTSSGNNLNSTSEELNRMIKILSDKEVITNSKNLPKHVNKASEIMANTKDINYSLDDLIELESLLLSEWNQQSQYLNNTSKLRFNWNKLASSNSGSNSKIIDDNFIISWIEEQNLVGSYTFAKLIKIVVLYNSLYGPFDKKTDFYNRLLVSFSDRFGSNVVSPVIEKLFNEQQILLNISGNNNEKRLANNQAQILAMDNNRKMLKLLDYMNYVPHTLNENILASAINDTITKTANVVGLAFLNPFSTSEEQQNKTSNDSTNETTDPLSFAYCGITPIITRFLQYSLTINPVSPSLLSLGIPSELLENVSKLDGIDSSSISTATDKSFRSTTFNEFSHASSGLLKVKETQLLKSKIGHTFQKENMLFSKNVVIITGGITLSEMATIDKLNRLITSVFDKSNQFAEAENKNNNTSFIPITVIADKII
ncbi:hypothetical protein ACO0SA_002289 [Hanseniaspora valbyensis]